MDIEHSLISYLRSLLQFNLIIRFTHSEEKLFVGQNGFVEFRKYFIDLTKYFG